MADLRRFTRIRPEQNEQRWYVVAWAPTLFDTWGVILAWGRLDDNRYRQRILEFPTPDEAAAEARTQMERRLKRGYTERPA
jgi:predicted DNA-binding WGR domain protein